ncbi:zinc-finger double domain-containing protein [Ditylenchus destructor]|nr:zinc-finger double domain-containing protein [Ditylenchus destructor]
MAFGGHVSFGPSVFSSILYYLRTESEKDVYTSSCPAFPTSVASRRITPSMHLKGSVYESFELAVSGWFSVFLNATLVMGSLKGCLAGWGSGCLGGRVELQQSLILAPNPASSKGGSGGGATSQGAPKPSGSIVSSSTSSSSNSSSATSSSSSTSASNTSADTANNVSALLQRQLHQILTSQIYQKLLQDIQVANVGPAIPNPIVNHQALLMQSILSNLLNNPAIKTEPKAEETSFITAGDITPNADIKPSLPIVQRKMVSKERGQKKRSSAGSSSTSNNTTPTFGSPVDKIGFIIPQSQASVPTLENGTRTLTMNTPTASPINDFQTALLASSLLYNQWPFGNLAPPIGSPPERSNLLFSPTLPLGSDAKEVGGNLMRKRAHEPSEVSNSSSGLRTPLFDWSRITNPAFTQPQMPEVNPHQQYCLDFFRQISQPVQQTNTKSETRTPPNLKKADQVTVKKESEKPVRQRQSKAPPNKVRRVMKPQMKTPEPSPSLPPRSLSVASSSTQNSDPENFQCKWGQGCNTVFTRIDDLVAHVTAHYNSDGDFRCYWQGCERAEPFSALYMLSLHVRRHTGEKPHICEEEGCTKRYSRLENLKTHQRTHKNEKPYKCNQCDKAFSNASDRAKHQTRTHSTQKAYRCPVENCEKDYTDPSSLRKHIKTQHGNETYELAKANKARNGRRGTYGSIPQSLGSVRNLEETLDSDNSMNSSKTRRTSEEDAKSFIYKECSEIDVETISNQSIHTMPSEEPVAARVDISPNDIYPKGSPNENNPGSNVSSMPPTSPSSIRSTQASNVISNQHFSPANPASAMNYFPAHQPKYENTAKSESNWGHGYSVQPRPFSHSSIHSMGNSVDGSIYPRSVKSTDSQEIFEEPEHLIHPSDPIPFNCGGGGATVATHYPVHQPMYNYGPDMEFNGEEFVHGVPITDRSDYRTHQPTSISRADVDWQRANGNRSVAPNDHLPTYEPVNLYGSYYPENSYAPRAYVQQRGYTPPEVYSPEYPAQQPAHHPYAQHNNRAPQAAVYNSPAYAAPAQSQKTSVPPHYQLQSHPNTVQPVYVAQVSPQNQPCLYHEPRGRYAMGNTPQAMNGYTQHRPACESEAVNLNNSMNKLTIDNEPDIKHPENRQPPRNH